MTYFLQGLTLGLAYVAPIGVQNIFVINTGISQKRSKAYMTALIVIFFDISLAFLCFFGVGLLLDQISLLKKAVLLIGGIVVMIMGIMLIKPSKKNDSEDENLNASINNMSFWKVLGTACVVTWFNPQAWIDGSLMLGASKASLPPDTSALFIAGVMIASCIWFLTLATITTVFKSKFSPKLLRGINIVCGAVIFIYGIKLILNFLEMTFL